MISHQGNFCCFCGEGAFTFCPKEDDTSTTADPEPSQPPPKPCKVLLSESITDTEKKAVSMQEPDQRTEPAIAPEFEPVEDSEQV